MDVQITQLFFTYMMRFIYWKMKGWNITTRVSSNSLYVSINVLNTHWNQLKNKEDDYLEWKE